MHFSYGMVELPDGKMKSREGTVAMPMTSWTRWSLRPVLSPKSKVRARICLQKKLPKSLAV